MKKLAIFTSLGLLLTASAGAQSLSSEFRTNGKEVLEVFEKQRQVLQSSSAVIYRGYKRVVYGIIVSEDGYILTKASEIAAPAPQKTKEGDVVKVAPLSVRIGENVLYKNVKVVGVDTGWDIALIKVDAKGLKPIEFAETSKLEQGRWVLTNGATSRKRRRVRAGIISAHARKIPGASPVVLGVGLAEKAKQLHIQGVAPKGGADKAGLKAGDIILKVDGVKVNTRDELVDYVSGKNPEETIVLTVKRGNKVFDAKVELAARPVTRPQRMSRNDQMSGRFSRRRDGFDRALQIDIPLQEHSCGGPLIKLDGKCIGMSIARANRAETFAIPSEELQSVLENLKK